jgi:uncharacterized damage-inducible protein DinB
MGGSKNAAGGVGRVLVGRHIRAPQALFYDIGAVAMNVDDIQTLYAYNRWATLRLFSSLEKLRAQQVATEVQSSFPSIRETVFHILFAEWLWLKRWQGVYPHSALPNPDATSTTWATLSPGGIPPAHELTTIAELKSFWDSIDRERQEFLAKLDDDSLHATVAFKDMAGNPYSEPLVQLLQHVVNHGTYHRGQVTTILRQAGAATVALDMLFFFREQDAEKT